VSREPPDPTATEIRPDAAPVADAYLAAAPLREVASADGTTIAIFSAATDRGSPIILVHGATADHTTWRTSGPLFHARHATHAVDRRGRGASGDGPDYAIEREFEDLAAVVDVIAAESQGPVDVVGHSYGGRIGLGAAKLTANLRRLVVYEGAPPPASGRGYQDVGILARIEALVAADDRDEALVTFMRDVIAMPPAELAAFRADPIWPRRAAAVETTIRELRAEVTPAASLEALGTVRQPVLQVLGGASAAVFGEATRALDARLRNGRIVTIEGARHAAHHTHAVQFVTALEAFLADPGVAD
jgi:pimeloyl-ACP methyl ester carboxylesterase